jgi:hypothetical protein
MGFDHRVVGRKPAYGSWDMCCKCGSAVRVSDVSAECGGNEGEAAGGLTRTRKVSTAAAQSLQTKRGPSYAAKLLDGADDRLPLLCP